MPTMTKPVLMPQMGESIAEGTIVRWIKKVGDTVDRDEPLFEISTDKVDAEIPSPAAGVLSEIKVREGETVAVNSVVATIGDSVAAVEDVAGRTAATRRSIGSRGAAAPPQARRKAEAAPPHGGGGNGAEAHPSRRTSVARARRRSCAGLPRSTTSTSRRCTARASAAG